MKKVLCIIVSVFALLLGVNAVVFHFCYKYKEKVDSFTDAQYFGFPQHEIKQETAQTVADFASLKAAVEAKTNNITITSSFDFEETLFIDYACSITADGEITLSRKDDFVGDFFVLGEDKDGNKTALTRQISSLNLTNLTIDGKNIEASGSIVFLYNGSKATLGSGLTIKNCLKTGNERTLKEDNFCKLSYPERVGGAVAIVDRAELVIDGAQLLDCSVNTSSKTEVSYNGGTIYSQGVLIMNSGLIARSKAASGAGIYNYATTYLNGGEITECVASSNGGAVATPNTQYGNLVVVDAKITNNKAKNGGAFHQNLAASILIDGNNEIKNNQSTQNGGAIYSRGSVVIKNANFESNKAGGYGGAIYQEHDTSKTDSTIRFCELHSGAKFINNSTDGEFGGAIAANKNAIIKIFGATFQGNRNASNLNSGSAIIEASSNSAGEIHIYEINSLDEVEDWLTTFNFQEQDGLKGLIIDHSTEA